jgi:5,6-dimethylbenzimidazole synthase
LLPARQAILKGFMPAQLPEQPDAQSLDHLLRVLAWRRDVRHFKTQTVDPAVIDRMIEIAQTAPSVGFSQPWRFVRVDDEVRRAAIRANFAAANEAAASEFSNAEQDEYRRLKLAALDDAPVHLAVFTDHASPAGRGLGRHTMPETLAFSTVMAVHTLWLAATALGLGLGWVSILDAEQASATLDVPEGWRLCAYLCVGYPKQPSLTPELERLRWESRDIRSRTCLPR